MHYGSEDAPKTGQAVRVYGSSDLHVRVSSKLQLPLIRGVLVSGSVRLEHAIDKGCPEDVLGLRVRLSPSPRLPFAEEVSPPVRPTGAFQVAAYPQQRYRLELLGLPERYFVKRALYNGADLGATPEFALDGSAEHSLIVLLSDRPARLLGQVSGDDRYPPSMLSVVLVRKDLSHFDRARNRIVYKPDAKGNLFRSGLTPGRYIVFAIPDSRVRALDIPGVLNHCAVRGIEITLQEGEAYSADVAGPGCIEP
jgi:hypothetical protein